MAVRPFAFGVRMRDPASGRTLRIRRDTRLAGAYVVEDEGPDRTRRARCDSAAEAVERVARIWRARLH